MIAAPTLQSNARGALSRAVLAGALGAGCLSASAQALQNAYHFHLEESPSAHRIETFQLIKSVSLDTLLPPVVEKIMRRITVLEHQNQHLVKLLDELMEALSEE